MEASTKLKQLIKQLQDELIKSHNQGKSDLLALDTLDDVILNYTPAQLLMWIRSGYRAYRKRKLKRNLPSNKHTSANQMLKDASPAQLAAIKKKLGIR